MTWTYPLDHDHGVGLDEAKALVGGKAANLGAMLGPDLRLPVPPGFAITTEACRAYLRDRWPDGLDEELRERMAEVESEVQRRFGDGTDPLLVSVRSGAPVSMPGMMDTILNLGLCEATFGGLAATTGDEEFARECRSRLGAQFLDVVGSQPPDDPWQQLRLAIEAVFQSWNSPRARAFRAREGIPDDLATAVTVQAMVFGNLGADSATGVVFTRNPATGEPELYGDVLFGAQGEDVVAGTHATEPIAVLDERLPSAAAELREHAARLERHYRDLCDIEFTIERGRLWMLQVRVGKRSPQAAVRIAHDMAKDPSFPLSRREAVERVAPLLTNPPRVTTAASVPADAGPPLVLGLGASPGIASGEIATTAEAAVEAAEAGRSVVLVRPETSPDDVHGMARAAGILTATGGLTSHAAVVARGWGIPAVVGAAGIKLIDSTVVVGDRTLRSGDVITIDGTTGEVREGVVTGTSQVVPEARTLLAWAEELGIPIGEAAVATPTPERAAAGEVSPGDVSPDDVVRRLATKGFATADSLADALLTEVGLLIPHLDRLVEDGLVKNAAGALRLTETGTARAAELLSADRAACGTDAAAEALDSFHALDARMKEIVTAWQLRPVDGGEPQMNDHSDARYDAAVVDRLAALHAEVDGFLASLEGATERLAGYRPRLTRALDRVRAGDQRYVASPRVDSYHGAWFELHEDLINLAGRTRGEEVAAGRA